MASAKKPMQADGKGTTKGAPDGVGQPNVSGRADPGESGGGAYPNPHKGKTPKEQAKASRHGGQSEINYYGTGQLGEKKVPGRKNVNAPTRKA